MLKIGPSGVRVASQFIGLLLVAPGFYIGFLGITDMAPSSPRGVAGFAELFGYLFWVWAVFSSINILSRRFLEDVPGRMGSLFAALVIAYGFYLLMDVIMFEASMKHKEAFTCVLQPLGWIAAFLLVAGLIRSAYVHLRPKAQ